MKKIWMIIRFLCLILTLILIVSCDDKNYDITLDASMNDLQLKVGEEKEIKYTVSLDGTASISLDNDNVSLNGNVIKGEKEGVTKVTITCNENNDITVQISIKVVKEEVKVTDILFDITTMTVGEEKEYKVTVLPDNATNKDYEIEVMGEALVIENGLLKGIKEGTSKVIVKTNELTKEFTIEVVKAEVKVTDILFDITSVSVGEEKEYKVTVLPDNATNKDYEIEVIGDALVIENGLLKGIKEGTSKVIVKTNDLTKEFTIEVVKAEVKVTDILFDITSVSVGEEKEYKVTVLPDNATNKDYEVEVIGDALVIENGLLKGVKEGTSKVIVKTNDLTKEFTIEVNNDDLKNAQLLLDWAFKQIGTDVYDYVNFPSKHPTIECKYTWISSDDELVTVKNGYVELVEFDEEISITCVLEYKGETYHEQRPITIIGFALDDLSNEFKSQFKGGTIYKDYDVVDTYNNYYGGSKVIWKSSNEEIFDSTGKFNKPIDDTILTIEYEVRLGEPNLSRKYSFDMLIEGKSLSDITPDLKAWIDENVAPDKFIDKNTVFPVYVEEFKADLVWLDTYGEPFNVDVYAGNPIFSSGVNVQVKVFYKGRTTSFDYHYNIKSEEYENKWDLVKLFVETISQVPLKSYSYVLYNWNGENFGYLPFYDNNESVIVEDIMPYTYGNQRTNIKKTSTEYIVVHDTGNTSETANAEMHRRYINNLNNSESSDSISWHFTVDQDMTIQHCPLDEVAYHAGDGSRVFGDTYYNETYKAWSIGGGNRNGIGIETCINKGSDYTRTMRRTAKLVAELLIKYNLGIDRVKQHNHFSGKDCPIVMRQNNRWEEFILLVQLEYFAKMYLNDVSFSWSSNVSFMDNTGRITSRQAIGTSVSYKVSATYKGQTNTYEFSSIICSK